MKEKEVDTDPVLVAQEAAQLAAEEIEEAEEAETGTTEGVVPMTAASFPTTAEEEDQDHQETKMIFHPREMTEAEVLTTTETETMKSENPIETKTKEETTKEDPCLDPDIPATEVDLTATEEEEMSLLSTKKIPPKSRRKLSRLLTWTRITKRSPSSTVTKLSRLTTPRKQMKTTNDSS